MTEQADRATDAPPPGTIPATIETKPAAPGSGPGQALERLADTARSYAAARSSTNTRKAYAADWAQFARWCRRKGFDVREPSAEVVGLFLAALASGDGIPKATVLTMERRLAATMTCCPLGTSLPRQNRHILDVMAGIRRTHAWPPKQKEALVRPGHPRHVRGAAGRSEVLSRLRHPAQRLRGRPAPLGDHRARLRTGADQGWRRLDRVSWEWRAAHHPWQDLLANRRDWARIEDRFTARSV